MAKGNKQSKNKKISKRKNLLKEIKKVLFLKRTQTKRKNKRKSPIHQRVLVCLKKREIHRNVHPKLKIIKRILSNFLTSSVMFICFFKNFLYSISK